jgi:hypothetical protein
MTTSTDRHGRTYIGTGGYDADRASDAAQYVRRLEIALLHRVLRGDATTDQRQIDIWVATGLIPPTIHA